MHRLPLLLYNNPKPPTIFCPVESVAKVRNMLVGFQECAGSQKEYKLQGVVPGESYYLQLGRLGKQDAKVFIHNCVHSISACGYGIWTQQKQLKPELKAKLQDLDGKAKGKFLQTQSDIYKQVWVPEFVYLCDTDVSVFKTDAVLSQYAVVMVECTFWETDMEPKAKETGHICFTQLLPWIQKHPDQHFILFHVSNRYSKETIRKIFDKANLQNCTLWKN